MNEDKINDGATWPTQTTLGAFLSAAVDCGFMTMGLSAEGEAEFVPTELGRDFAGVFFL